MLQKISNNNTLECTIKSTPSIIELSPKDTYSFLYESDIQRMLFAKLRQPLPYTIENKW